MNVDQTREGLWALVQEVHRRMNEDAQFQEVFANQQFDLEYQVTDLDMTFAVCIDHGRVDLIPTESDDPAIVMEMNTSYFHKMCGGGIVVPLAILTKRIKMTLRDREKAAGAFPLTAITRRLYITVHQEFKAAGKWVPG